MVSLVFLCVKPGLINYVKAAATVSDSVPIETAHEDMIVRVLQAS